MRVRETVYTQTSPTTTPVSGNNMMRSFRTTCLILAGLALLMPGALAAEDDTADPASTRLPGSTDHGLEDCAPPCGYIYPIITLHTDLKTPIKAADIADLPSEVPVTVDFWWDFEQDGTGIPDKTDMTLTTVITKKPSWLKAELTKPVCTFTLNPAVSDYPAVCGGEMVLKLEVLEVPDSVDDIEPDGKRLMLFTTSEESGTFKKSYGVKDIRFKPDDTLAATDAALTEESPALPVVAPLAALGALLVAARHAHRRD